MAGIDLDDWSGANATKSLQASIEKSQKDTAFQGRVMIFLAAVAAIAAIIAAVPVVKEWLH